MDKRGELSTQQMVVLIILIASFGIILFFIARLNLGETSEQEICHNSVITRGSSVLPTGSVPLNCKRSYVCLTRDGSCESLTKPIKEKVETKEEVYRVLAEEMATCWWMFGEGKINYVGSEIIPDLYCSICSQIAFDDSTKDILGGEIQREEFYSYLSEKKVVGKDQTYAQYLFGTNDISTLYDGEFGRINLDAQQYVLMGVTSEVSGLGWGLAVGGAVALIAWTPVIGPVAGLVTGLILTTGGTTAGYFIGPTILGDSGQEFISPLIVETNSEEFKALGCESITTLS